MKELVQQLTAAYGPSGRETEVADLIEKLLKGKVDSFHRDALGNLICEKKGTDKKGKRIMFSAHMDQIGMVVTHIEKEGYLRISGVGGLSVSNLRMRRVKFQNGVQGVMVEQPLKPGDARPVRAGRPWSAGRRRRAGRRGDRERPAARTRRPAGGPGAGGP